MANPLKHAIDVLHVHQQLRDRRVAETGLHRYSIAVSRQAFAQGSEICAKLNDRLPGWHVYDQDIMQAVAQDMNVSEKLIEGLDYDKHGWIKDALAQMSGTPDQTTFALHLKKVIAAIASEGHAILLGRGAGLFLPREYCFRIHLVAEEEVRLHRCMERLKLDRASAAKKVQQIDNSRRAFVKDYFGAVLSDPNRADVIFNTTATPIDACADAALILAAARWPDFPGA